MGTGRRVLGAALCLLALAVPGEVVAAPQSGLGMLLDEEPAAPAAAASAADGPRFVGTVIYDQGGQVVAELDVDAEPRQYLVVYDVDFRRKGKAVVVRPLKAGTFILRAARGGLDTGDRLALETELEAANRVLRQHDAASYRAFLGQFPRSSYRGRIQRELFRALMQTDYPASPGGVIDGQVRLVESAPQEIPLANVQVVLDRFVIATTDEGGRFRIEGLPLLADPVRLALRVRDPKFLMAEDVPVTLPQESTAALEVQLPVRFTPTVLAGRVLDPDGEPAEGAEVWTSPYSMEVLTDEDGRYRIARRKQPTPGAGLGASDEPLFGGEYEVYARRPGLSVERAVVAVDSYQENEVPTLRLRPQDPRREDLPALALDLKSHLWLSPAALVVPQGGGPRINP